MINLLLISAGSLVGQNILGVLGRRRDRVKIVATNSTPMANLYSIDKVYLTPPSSNPPSDFTDKLTSILEEEQPDLVIPGRDRDVTVLSRFGALNERWQHHLLCGSVKAAEIMEDKWRSFEFCQKYQLPFAHTALADASDGHKNLEQLLMQYGFPLVAKLRQGFASKGVNIIFDEPQLQNYLQDDNYIFQQYLGKPEDVRQFRNTLESFGLPLFYSLEQEKFAIQVCLAPDGTASEVFTTVHEMKNGVSMQVQLCYDPELSRIGERFAEAMAKEGHIGPLNIQCQKSAEGDYICYEMSGRLTGASHARYLLGFDELSICLKYLSDKDLKPCIDFNSHSVVSKQQMTVRTADAEVQTLKNHGYILNQSNAR